MTPQLILINPWIYDFAAYDLWSKPLGLLYLAGYLRDCGFRIHLIDCLDVHHPLMKEDASFKAPTRRLYGTGKFWRHEIPKPPQLHNIQRPYSRYGLSLTTFEEELKKIRNPAAILVTSLMTYWYPGVREVIRLCNKNHPGTPVILGGIYATLCHDHAIGTSGADNIIAGNDPVTLLKVLNGHGIDPPRNIPDPTPAHLPYPAFDLLSRIDYICLLTSIGCPYRCRYCASHYLNPALKLRDPDDVRDEILYWHKEFGADDFAFYDDALLVSSNTHMAVLLEGLSDQYPKLRFHTPNAIHIREVNAKIARLMYRAGFKTIRLGLESADISIHHALDNKVEAGEFEKAVSHLLEAGFSKKDIGAYILIGLPGQSADSVIRTLDFVDRTGALPYLSNYSPIPHTSLWDDAVRHSEYDIASEPLYHNNTLLPCWDKSRKKELPRIRQYMTEIRQKHR